jgi:hypothetical protein
MSLNEQLQEVHSQSFGTEKKILSNFSVDNASTADNKVIHGTFEKPEELVEGQPEEQEESKKETTARIHDLIRASGRVYFSFEELEEMDPSDRKSLSTDKAFQTQKQLLAFLAKHNLTKQFCTDVNQQLTVMELCWRYQTAYELMRNVAKELQTPFKAPTKEKPKKKLPDNFLLAEMVGKISNLEQQIKELRGEHTVLNKIIRDVNELIVVTHNKLGEIREYSDMR